MGGPIETGTELLVAEDEGAFRSQLGPLQWGLPLRAEEEDRIAALRQLLPALVEAFVEAGRGTLRNPLDL